MKYYIKDLKTKKSHGFTYAIDSAIKVSEMIPNSGVFRKNKIDNRIEKVF